MNNVEQADDQQPEGTRRRAFKNRRDAGQQLAPLLGSYRGSNPLVLALPRGGVPVAFEVATYLNAPLRAFPTRKIGAPGQPELGIGAVAPGGTLVLNEQTIRELEIPREDVDLIIARETKELDDRISLYWRDDGGLNLSERVVILVDDGLATGSTAWAALRALRNLRVQHLTLAVPICASQTAQFLFAVADTVVCVLHTDNLSAVGLWYDNFEQTSDQEVAQLLDQADRLYRESDSATAQ
ncbi:MAG: phosphoribosyltransferase family protein [Chloroflexia bacterium]